MTIHESNLVFEFDEVAWEHLIKFDDCEDYRKVSQALSGTKGVDFIGILKPKRDLVIIEVKNYRGHRIEAKPKIEELASEVAQKVRDSLAVIISAARSSTHNKECFESQLNVLINNKKKILIVLWLEQDADVGRSEKVHLKIVLDKLKHKLNWLSTRILITSTKDNPLSLNVTFTSQSL